ncbi:MAG: nitroreductase family protein [Candidatus Omnitrophota bacterium]|jgi:nitroreductase
MPSFMELARTRRSIRTYSDKGIGRGDLELCVEAARYSPSACHSQPWSFIIIDDPEKKKQTANALAYGPGGMNSFAHNAKAFIAIVSEKQTFPAWLGGKIRNVNFRHTDAGIACAHLILQAWELGIGTCIIGWFNEKKLKRILSVPFYKKIELVVALGYPAEAEIPEKQLKEKSDVISYNRY